MRIKSLSTAVANQIAAGEVIENPASVVKELLENALDAQANQLIIDIGFGGLNQIKISDNGMGIQADDLPLAIAPHATSKLTTLNDLTTLTSMGFRGEALASIASVSRLTLSSKPADQAHAMALQTDGATFHVNPCARNQGTTVDVRDLFYNAPVRRRFLKSERSEYLAIEHVVKRFALGTPAIAIRLTHNGKPMLDLPAATCKRTHLIRIQKILGKGFIEHAIQLDIEHAGMRLSGWISGPSYQRSQNDKQWFYLNQRMIKDKLVLHAFKQAYDGILYPGRYPACLLYLTMPTAEVDINVHPTKHEVRFQQSRLVHDFIESQIRLALDQACPSDGAALSPGQEDKIIPFQPMVLEEPKPTFSPPHTTGSSPRPYRRPVSVPEVHLNMETLQSISESTPRYRQPIPLSSKSTWVILNPAFMVLFWQNQSYLIHLARAQEAQLFHALQQQSLPLASRPLLVPIREPITHNETEHLRPLFESFAQYGIDCDLTDQHLCVRAIPVCMPQLNLSQLLHHLLQTPTLPAELPGLLIRYQSSDVDHPALVDFLLKALQEETTDRAWCTLLNPERCLELMDV